MSDKHAQTIFRNASADKPYSMILNRALQDAELSPEAGWVLVFMLSQTKNWSANLKHVAARRRMGRDRVQKAVAELCSRGYCKRIQNRKNDGRMGAYEYWFTDEPGIFGSPEPDDQAPVSPEPEQPAPVVPAPEDQAPYKVSSPTRIEKGEERVSFDGLAIQLHGDLKTLWLGKFDGDAERLELALIAAVPYVQLNSNRPLEAQVSAQLARSAADKRDRDKRSAARAAAGRSPPVRESRLDAARRALEIAGIPQETTQ